MCGFVRHFPGNLIALSPAVIAQVRLTGVDLAKFQLAEEGFGNVKTEHAFNGLGILDKVCDCRKGSRRNQVFAALI